MKKITCALFLFMLIVLVSGCGTAKAIHPDWSGWKKVGEIWFNGGGYELPPVSNILMTGEGLIIISEPAHPENYSWKGEILHLFLNDKGELKDPQQFVIRSKWASCCRKQEIYFKDERIVFKIIPKSGKYFLMQASERKEISEFQDVFYEEVER